MQASLVKVNKSLVLLNLAHLDTLSLFHTDPGVPKNDPPGSVVCADNGAWRAAAGRRGTFFHYTTSPTICQAFFSQKIFLFFFLKVLTFFLKVLYYNCQGERVAGAR